MNYSEQILIELHALAKKNGCGMFEAASDYCRDNDLDQDDFIKTLDKNVIEQLKLDAVNTRRVRRCIQSPAASLI
jgi:hypothetical protein